MKGKFLQHSLYADDQVDITQDGEDAETVYLSIYVINMENSGNEVYKYILIELNI